MAIDSFVSESLSCPSFAQPVKQFGNLYFIALVVVLFETMSIYSTATANMWRSQLERYKNSTYSFLTSLSVHASEYPSSCVMSLGFPIMQA